MASLSASLPLLFFPFSLENLVGGASKFVLSPYLAAGMGAWTRAEYGRCLGPGIIHHQWALGALAPSFFDVCFFLFFPLESGGHRGPGEVVFLGLLDDHRILVLPRVFMPS